MAGIEPIFGIEFIGPSNSQCTLWVNITKPCLREQHSLKVSRTRDQQNIEHGECQIDEIQIGGIIDRLAGIHPAWKQQTSVVRSWELLAYQKYFGFSFQVFSKWWRTIFAEHYPSLSLKDWKNEIPSSRHTCPLQHKCAKCENKKNMKHTQHIKNYTNPWYPLTLWEKNPSTAYWQVIVACCDFNHLKPKTFQFFYLEPPHATNGCQQDEELLQRLWSNSSGSCK